MKYDKKIKTIIKDINFNSKCYLEDVEYMNEGAATNRIIETIIEKAKELENYHNKRFEKTKKDKDIELLQDMNRYKSTTDRGR